MAITTAVQRGSFVYVYNEHGRVICSLPAGSAPNDGLKGYTGSSVSIQRGPFIYVYDENGHQMQSIPAK